MIPLLSSSPRRRRRVSRHHRGGIQRADAAVAAADRRAQRSSGRAGRLSGRSAAALRAGSVPARPGDGDRRRCCSRQAIGLDGVRSVALVVLSVTAFVIVCELVLPVAIVVRDPERVLELLLPSFAPIAEGARAAGAVDGALGGGAEARAGAAVDAGRSGDGSQRGREGLHRERRAGRHHRRRGTAPAAEHRRFRRHPGARSHDPAPRHRRDQDGRDDRRPARAVSRAGVFAVSGLQGEPRQHRRLRLHQGPGPAGLQRRRPADRAR